LIVALPAHAKINLALKVAGKRPDGYHDIDTTLQSISLHDLLQAERAEETTLELHGGDAPSGEGNLVLRALQTLERSTGRRLPLRFTLWKRIPSGAGLGGGSADAAAALRLAGRLYGLQVALPELAAQIGADVPFFLTGGCARAMGRGEMIEARPPCGTWFAVAWPGLQVSTAAVYSQWAPGQMASRNDLQEAAMRVEPSLRDYALKLGDDWRMTGSGSAFFRACRDRSSAEAAIAGLDGWKVAVQAVGPWG
jgi:4-diphosphocytidyl-2-C-methyl-D-erythritol kinase